MTDLTSIGCDQYISICTDHTVTLILLHPDCQLQVLEASADRAVLDTDRFAMRKAVASVARSSAAPSVPKDLPRAAGRR